MMRLRLLYLILRKHKWTYLIPIVAIFGLVPLMIYMRARAFGLDVADPYSATQMLVPILSTWWLFLCFKEYIEGDGVELLYTYLPKRKSKLQDIFLLFLWYILHVSILHFGLSFWFDGMLWECIRSIVQCYFFVMFYYMMMYLVKSTSISYMVVMVYYFMTMFFCKTYNFRGDQCFFRRARVSVFIDAYILNGFSGCYKFCNSGLSVKQKLLPPAKIIANLFFSLI